MKCVLTGVMDTWSEDGGQARIGELSNDGEDLFVRVHSYSEMLRQHDDFEKLEGREIRITIETVGGENDEAVSG